MTGAENEIREDWRTDEPEGGGFGDALFEEWLGDEEDSLSFRRGSQQKSLFLTVEEATTGNLAAVVQAISGE